MSPKDDLSRLMRSLRLPEARKPVIPANEPPFVMFLFGAGASYGSELCEQHRPPVGDHLFEAMRSQQFIKAALPLECEKRFLEPQGFERGMACLASHSSAVYNPFLRAMALFFCRYRPRTGNTYAQLFGELLFHEIPFKVATLNYENLAELALRQLPGLENFNHSFIRPHGSCGFLPALGNHRFDNCVASHASYADFVLPLGPFELRQESIEQWCNDPKHSSAPVMSFFTSGKHTPVNPNAIEEHRLAFAAFVERAAMCFLVGVRYNGDDGHIWKPLATASGELLFVNPNEGDSAQFRDWAQTARTASVDVLPSFFSEAVPKIVERARNVIRA